MKYILLAVLLIAANILGSKGILFHKQAKIAYRAIAAELKDEEKP
jgi:hypothetical protein